MQGNPRVYKALRDQIVEVLDELRRIDARSGVDAGSSTDTEGSMDAGNIVNDGDGVSDELLEVIRMIAVILDGMRCED